MYSILAAVCCCCCCLWPVKTTVWRVFSFIISFLLAFVRVRVEFNAQLSENLHRIAQKFDEPGTTTKQIAFASRCLLLPVLPVPCFRIAFLCRHRWLLSGRQRHLLPLSNATATHRQQQQQQQHWLCGSHRQPTAVDAPTWRLSALYCPMR